MSGLSVNQHYRIMPVLLVYMSYTSSTVLPHSYLQMADEYLNLIIDKAATKTMIHKEAFWPKANASRKHRKRFKDIKIYIFL